MTPAQLEVLVKLVDEGGGGFLRGPQVRAAQRLAKAGLVTLDDNGTLTLSGRSDGERWYAKPTQLGRLTLRAIREAVKINEAQPSAREILRPTLTDEELAALEYAREAAETPGPRTLRRAVTVETWSALTRAGFVQRVGGIGSHTITQRGRRALEQGT